MEIIDVASVIAGLVILCVGGYAIVSGGVTVGLNLEQFCSILVQIPYNGTHAAISEAR